MLEGLAKKKEKRSVRVGGEGKVSDILLEHPNTSHPFMIVSMIGITAKLFSLVIPRNYS